MRLWFRAFGIPSTTPQICDLSLHVPACDGGVAQIWSQWVRFMASEEMVSLVHYCRFMTVARHERTRLTGS